MKFLKIFLIFTLFFALSEAFCCHVKNSWRRWNKNDLTYKIVSYSEQFRKEYLDFVFEQAFKLYEQNAGVTFRSKKFGHVDITIRFDRSDEHAFFRMNAAPAGAFSFPPGVHEVSGERKEKNF